MEFPLPCHWMHLNSSIQAKHLRQAVERNVSRLDTKPHTEVAYVPYFILNTVHSHLTPDIGFTDFQSQHFGQVLSQSYDIGILKKQSHIDNKDYELKTIKGTIYKTLPHGIFPLRSHLRHCKGALCYSLIGLFMPAQLVQGSGFRIKSSMVSLIQLKSFLTVY